MSQYAYLTEKTSDGGDVTQHLIVVLDEVDRAATKLINSPESPRIRLSQRQNPECIDGHGVANPNWTYMLPYRKFPIPTFLSLTIRLGLYSYVEVKVNKDCLRTQRGKTWPLLADAVAFDEEVSTYFDCGPLVNVEMANLLLSRGADPNLTCNTGTVWKILLENRGSADLTSVVGSPFRAYMEIVILFLQHGADRTSDVRSSLRHALERYHHHRLEVRELLHGPSDRKGLVYELASDLVGFWEKESENVRILAYSFLNFLVAWLLSR